MFEGLPSTLHSSTWRYTVTSRLVSERRRSRVGLNLCMQVFVTNEMLIITFCMDFPPEVCFYNLGIMWWSILGQAGIKTSNNFQRWVLLSCQKSLCLSRCHISHHPFVSNTCCTSPFCPLELWRLIWGYLRLVLPDPACQSLGEDRWHAEINNLTQHHPFCEQMNLLWQYVYERSGDLLSSHLNILYSPPLPKRTVIYGSWALRSCVLWCLIQGPTTRQGGERGCVGNSLGLRSSGTLISYKYSPCCSHWSPSLWLLWSYSMQGLNVCGRWTDSHVDQAEAESIKSVWRIKNLVSMTFLEVFLKHPHPKAAMVVGVNSNQNPVLSALSSNSNALLSDL